MPDLHSVSGGGRNPELTRAAPGEGAGVPGEGAALVEITGPGQEPDRTLAGPAAGPSPGEPSASKSSAAAAPKGAEDEAPRRWLRGRVLHPDGSPARGALVSLIQWSDGAPVSSGNNARVRSDGAGDFTLEVPPWAWDRTVHLSARRAGSRPYSKSLSMDQTAMDAHHELQLLPGHAIEGRVMLHGEPLAGVSVGFDVAYGVPGIYGAGTESWWADGRMEEKHGSARTDENGFFSVGGLSPKEHRVSIDGPVRTNQIHMHLFAVTAPDSRLYDLTPATLGVSVRSQTGPLVGAEVTVCLEHVQVKVTSGMDPADVEVPPGQTLRVIAEHPSAERVEQRVVAPAAGQWVEVSVPMRLVERPRLLVTVIGAEADQISLRITGQGNARSAALEAHRLGAGGPFAVEAVPLGPGPYLLSFEPGTSASRQGFLYPSATDLLLPVSGDVHAELTWIQGGRCEVKVDSESEFGAASFQLVDAAGRVCMARSVSSIVQSVPLAGELVEISSVMTSSALFFEEAPLVGPDDHARQRSDASGILLPGIYTLNANSEGFEPWAQQVEIFAGKVTVVEAWLEESAK